MVGLIKIRFIKFSNIIVITAPINNFPYVGFRKEVMEFQLFPAVKGI